MNYEEIGTRKEIKITDQNLIKTIEIKSLDIEVDLENIVQIANEITKENLVFTTDHVSSNPNELMNSKQANCIGYSAMFNSIANHLIRTNELEGVIESKHKIARLEFLGIDLHQFIKDPFFRDHDFNQIKNVKTGELISIDPSVSDYLWINRVNVK